MHSPTISRLRFIKIALLLVCAVVFALAWITSAASIQQTTSSPTATEARGGLMGSVVPMLRCPYNLSGIGPTWRSLQVGVSTLDDLKTLYAPYGQEPGVLTQPGPPYIDYPEGEYAPIYYIYIEPRDFRPKLGLPAFMQVCLVENRIEAMSFYVEHEPSLPPYIPELISLMGRPTLTSWHESDRYSRLLHWPSAGMSVEVWGASAANASAVVAVYYYPFQGEDYRECWPIKYVLTEQPDYVLYPRETVELEIIDYDAVEATLTVSPAWPTRTVTPASQATAAP